MPVGGRAFEIIEVLAQSAGELVTKAELTNRIWPGAVVMDGTLHVHAGAIRKALGPYRNLLKTESGRGYRLLGDWSVRRHDAANPPTGVQRMRVRGESPVTNIPATVTHLIGRSAAVARLRDFISAYRLVTLTGPGGIGKTSLALKVTRGVLGEFADGGWLVELSSLSDPALVPAAVAGVLRLAPEAGNATPDAVARAIGDKRLLLILDNCEHLIEAAAALTETLLAFCPHTSIVATSRETLRVQGEHVWRVPPLEVPPIEQTGAAGILGHSAAELFLTRAAQLGADVASDPGHPAMIGAICRQLDGIPLAIEFAAARAAALGIEHVARGLQDRFALLTNGRRTALARHRTLRAALDWSYHLLTEAERDLLRRLAIFAGPFSLEAACAVAAAPDGSKAGAPDASEAGASEAEIAVRIADLVGKSLVARTAGRFTPEFRLLESTRAYAADRLAETGATAEVARRHAAYFLGTLGTLDEVRRSEPADAWAAAFRRCADEVHVALEWAFSPAGDPAIGVALTLAAVPLWFDLFQVTVARGRLEQAMGHVDADSDQELRLTMAMGHALWYHGPGSKTIEPIFSRALDLAERRGAPTARAQALWGLWAARRAHGDYPAALEMAQRMADAAASARDRGTMHLADRILGLTHHVMGQQAVARVFTERALQQPHYFDPASGIGYQVDTPVAMGAQMARILWLLGFPQQAMEAASAAMTAARNTGHSFPVVYAVTFAGFPMALWTGAPEEARRHADLLAAHTAGNPRAEQWELCCTRLLELRERSPRDALIASFMEARMDVGASPPLADLASVADLPLPLPGPEPADVLRSCGRI